jgi:hypothetical protein
VVIVMIWVIPTFFLMLAISCGFVVSCFDGRDHIIGMN